MNPERDEGLHRLLHDAVDDLEPRDALAEIRARTGRTHGRVRGSRHHWSLALGGAVAVASVIVGAAVLGDALGDGRPGGPATSPTSPSEPGPTSSTERPTRAVPVYYLVDTERAGPRLVREFRSGALGDPAASALALLQEQPLDPDYRTAWPAGSLESAEVADDIITVRLTDATLLERPADLSTAEARMAVEQVVWTVQGVAQSRLPVRFVAAGQEVDRVLGVPLPGPVDNGQALEVLNHVSITSPEQGVSVDERLTLSGVANSFEASLSWELRRGSTLVRDGYATMEGWAQQRLHPFEVEIDVRDLEPGEYTIRATTDDPTGGTEGVGAMTDSKEFTIR